MSKKRNPHPASVPQCRRTDDSRFVPHGLCAVPASKLRAEPRLIPSYKVETLAPKVESKPRMAVAPDTVTHTQRASWAQECQRTHSQGRRPTAAERADALALAVDSRIPSARSTVVELARYAEDAVENVEHVLAGWEEQCLVVRPSKEHIHTLTLLFMEARTGGAE